ncbi:MAG: hypothetical protein LDL56_01735 [Armatimonadetes bacterium]|nr:hypothetical protein [Armatimonadota bacterium]
MPQLKLPGRYPATVLQASVGEAQNANHTPYAMLLLRTDQGEQTDAFLYLSEKAFDRSVRTLVEVFGFNGDFETLDEQLRDKRCAIVAEEEQDDFGRPRVRVRWINPEAPPRADTELLVRLTKRAAVLLATANPPTASRRVTTAGDDDKIPF